MPFLTEFPNSIKIVRNLVKLVDLINWTTCNPATRDRSCWLLFEWISPYFFELISDLIDLSYSVLCSDRWRTPSKSSGFQSNIRSTRMCTSKHMHDAHRNTQMGNRITHENRVTGILWSKDRFQSVSKAKLSCLWSIVQKQNRWIICQVCKISWTVWKYCAKSVIVLPDCLVSRCGTRLCVVRIRSDRFRRVTEPQVQRGHRASAASLAIINRIFTFMLTNSFT